MAEFKKNPLMDGVVREINEYSQNLEKRVDDAVVEINQDLQQSIKDTDENINNLSDKVDSMQDDMKPILIELTLSSGWSNVSGYGKMRAKKINDIVYLFGMISSGTSDTIFTLPEELRPNHTHRGIALVGSGTTYVTIRPNGIVTATSAEGRSNLSLSGIVYSID